MNKIIFISDFSTASYPVMVEAMQSYIASRKPEEADTLWLGEHELCYTQGIRSHQELPNQPSTIPVYPSNRGGQMTHHGPGQLILYPLLNLKRLNLNHSEYVYELEAMLITFLSKYNIQSKRRPNAPGIYTLEGQKIASLGLRIKHNISYHGVAINIAMDLAPFRAITPCGLSDITMANMADLALVPAMPIIKQEFISHFAQHFGYNKAENREFNYL